MQILFSGAIPNREHQRGATALLGIFDVERGEIVHRTLHHPPPELHAPGQKVQFTGFCFLEDRLWVCTHNSIEVFEDWPPREPTRRLSLPSFNDLHHCAPWQGGLAVANTGLETVDWITLDGQLKERWDMLAGIAGARRIDPDADLRLVPDTKPHLRHPNHVFDSEGRLWVTRLESRDAICLSEPGLRIAFSQGMPHDGSRIGDDLVFTTVNGFVIRIDPRDERPRRTWDLSRFEDRSELGWCRGVCGDPANPEGLFVSFSMVRRPRWREVGYRLKHLHRAPPSRLCRYDLREGSLVSSWQLGEHKGFVLFQLHPLDPDRFV